MSLQPFKELGIVGPTLYRDRTGWERLQLRAKRRHPSLTFDLLLVELPVGGFGFSELLYRYVAFKRGRGHVPIACETHQLCLRLMQPRFVFRRLLLEEFRFTRWTLQRYMLAQIQVGERRQNVGGLLRIAGLIANLYQVRLAHPLDRYKPHQAA